MADPFALDQYLARRKVLAAFTPKFHVYDPTGQLVAYVEQKAFKLKEDITVFGDEQKQKPLLIIKARQALDISATYDVTDARTGAKVGALRRKGLKSILRDEWTVLDTADREIGKIEEDSALMATLRRFLSNLIPQSFHVTLNGQPSGVIKQHFNPFVLKHTVDLTSDTGKRFDRRLALAAVVLLLAIEGRQQ
ncbi:MAG: hypothetical protein HY656_02120 [Acidobacteria bacterium]|nr:hypothetical protein [Acidobacteriota bacterium]